MYLYLAPETKAAAGQEPEGIAAVGAMEMNFKLDAGCSKECVYFLYDRVWACFYHVERR